MSARLLWVSLGFMAGILLASVLRLHHLIWIGLALCGLVGGYFAQRSTLQGYAAGFRSISIRVRREAILLVAAALVSAFLGAARFQWSLPTQDDSRVSWYNDAGYEVLVSGTLVDAPDVRDTYINLRLRVSGLDAGTGPIEVQGLVLARAAPN